MAEHSDFREADTDGEKKNRVTIQFTNAGYGSLNLNRSDGTSGILVDLKESSGRSDR